MATVDIGKSAVSFKAYGAKVQANREARMLLEIKELKKLVKHQQGVIDRFLSAGAKLDKKPEAKSAAYRRQLAQRKQLKAEAFESCTELLSSDAPRKTKLVLMLEAGCAYVDIAKSLDYTQSYVKYFAYMNGMNGKWNKKRSNIKTMTTD